MNARLWHEGEPLDIKCDPHGRPQQFRWRQQLYEVERICNRWRIHEEWWREQTSWQEYIKLITRNGVLCVLAHDLETNQWTLVRIYD